MEVDDDKNANNNVTHDIKNKIVIGFKNFINTSF